MDSSPTDHDISFAFDDKEVHVYFTFYEPTKSSKECHYCKSKKGTYLMELLVSRIENEFGNVPLDLPFSRRVVYKLGKTLFNRRPVCDKSRCHYLFWKDIEQVIEERESAPLAVSK